MKDEEMADEALMKLKTLRVAAPSAEARKLAVNAALVAFDEAQAGVRAQQAARPKRWYNSSWGLSTSLAGLGAAAVALVLLPVGTQLYTASSRGPEVRVPETATLSAASGTAAKQSAAPVDKPKPVMEKTSRPAADESQSEAKLAVAADALRAAPAPMNATRQAANVAAASGHPMGLMSTTLPAIQPQNGTLAGSEAAPLGFTATEPSGDTFQKFDESRVKITADEPVSTFSIDVDTASFSYVRGLIEAGQLPQPDAVRVEEMINYFPYDYPAPATTDTPFRATMQVFPTPWNEKTELLEIGLKGYVPPVSERQPENLTFLIDTSGSMDEPNKLPLLKRSFELLVDNLRPTDTVAIVTYAGSAGVVLRPTAASDKAAILGALDRLEAGGSTAGAEGIDLAYQVAAQGRAGDSVNRVILATDGDFNVGIDTPDDLETFIRRRRDEGIFLSVIGFGRGNLDDALMQALAQNGNGNASYIDSLSEARKVLVEQAGANFVTIAKDVKVQVEFNPAQVSEYRLIGYETRALNREDFNNDTVDAGEIGAGHTVTALYEITPAGSGGELNDPLRYRVSETPTAKSDELGFLKLRYKAPDGKTSKLITAPITRSLVLGELSAAGNDQRFAAAVAAFAQKLKGSAYGAGMSWQAIIDLANGAKGEDPDGYRAAFVQEIKLAAALSPDLDRSVPATPTAAAPAH